MNGKFALQNLLVASAYVILAQAGFELALDDGVATTVWPPMALAVTSLLLGGNRYLPGLFAGAFATVLIKSGAVLPSGLIAAGNTLAAWMTVFFYTSRFQVSDFLEKISARLHLLVSAVCSTSLSAAIGTATLHFVVQKQGLKDFETFLTWWTGDGIAAIVMVPLVIAVSFYRFEKINWKNPVLLSFIACALIVISAVFLNKYDIPAYRQVARNSLMLLMLLMVINFEQLIAFIFLNILALAAIIATSFEYGPFATNDLNQNLIVLQLYLGTMTTATLILTAALREHKMMRLKTEQSLKEKELLLAEIHHRVKNNLAVIDGLLYLQSLKLENQAQRDVFLQTQAQVKSIALVHEKLYKKDSLTTIAFDSYINDLVSKISETYPREIRKVSFNVSAEKVSLDITRAIPCGLILNELLTNAIKHAFPDQSKGIVNINLFVREGRYVMKVQDDGKGFSMPEAVKSNSLGLTLVNELTEQLQGTVTINSQRGTAIEVEF